MSIKSKIKSGKEKVKNFVAKHESAIINGATLFVGCIAGAVAGGIGMATGYRLGINDTVNAMCDNAMKYRDQLMDEDVTNE